MTNIKQFLQSSAIICTVLALVSCAYTKEKLDLETALSLTFEVSSDVNPDSDGRSSPVVLNLLYLKDNRQFEQENFIALLESPENRLGKDLIETTRLKEFIPSETRAFEKVLSEQVQYVGIIVEYIQYQDAVGKLVLPIQAHSGNDYEIVVGKSAISVK